MLDYKLALRLCPALSKCVHLTGHNHPAGWRAKRQNLESGQKREFTNETARAALRARDLERNMPINLRPEQWKWSMESLVLSGYLRTTVLGMRARIYLSAALLLKLHWAALRHLGICWFSSSVSRLYTFHRSWGRGWSNYRSGLCTRALVDLIPTTEIQHWNLLLSPFI